MTEELFNRSKDLKSKVAIYYMQRADSLRYTISILKASTQDQLSINLLADNALTLETKATQAELFFDLNGQEMIVDENIPTAEPKPKL